MQLYTINATCEQSKYTTEQNEENHRLYATRVAQILAGYGIDGFTIENCLGYWQGVPEVSYRISVALESDENIIRICQALRDAYQQDAVMLTTPDGSVRFI